MPERTVVLPVAAAPTDRLTLGAADARDSAVRGSTSAGPCYSYCNACCACLAEE